MHIIKKFVFDLNSMNVIYAIIGNVKIIKLGWQIADKPNAKCKKIKFNILIFLAL